MRRAGAGPAEAAPSEVGARVEALDWASVSSELDGQGWATFARLLSAGECKALAALYDDERRFRSRVVMARHGFGRGEYQYFAHPLPELVAELRTALYPRLAPIANRWNEAMRVAVRFPGVHAEFLERCHEAGQTRPTPLLLRYGAGDYNCLHQDLYGEHVFPLQVAILLSEPAEDFSGGSSCSPSSARGCSRGPTWCPCVGETPWCSR